MDFQHSDFHEELRLPLRAFLSVCRFEQDPASQPSQKGNGLSPISVEAVRKALGEIRREARKRVAPYLCISIVTFEISHVSTGDCFAALCLVSSRSACASLKETAIL